MATVILCLAVQVSPFEVKEKKKPTTTTSNLSARSCVSLPFRKPMIMTREPFPNVGHTHTSGRRTQLFPVARKTWKVPLTPQQWTLWQRAAHLSHISATALRAAASFNMLAGNIATYNLEARATAQHEWKEAKAELPVQFQHGRWAEGPAKAFQERRRAWCTPTRTTREESLLVWNFFQECSLPVQKAAWGFQARFCRACEPQVVFPGSMAGMEQETSRPKQ